MHDSKSCYQYLSMYDSKLSVFIDNDKLVKKSKSYPVINISKTKQKWKKKKNHFLKTITAS